MTIITHNSNKLPPGYKLHWYIIGKVLGDGGFGITYLAQDVNLDQKVAIKEFFPHEFVARSDDLSIHPTLSDKQHLYEWGLSRFVEEAQTLAKLRHKNIVTVHNVFCANKTAYIVMDYIQGDNLKVAIQQNLFEAEASIYDLLYPILEGLSQVHRTGFIHRDIKPSNIILQNNQIPILIDFGSSRQAGNEDSQRLTALISKGYTPFEQYEQSHSEKQGPWSDIYGLGATLYNLVTNEHPIDSVTRIINVVNEQPDPLIPAAILAKHKYSIPLLEAIDTALQLKPKDRPQSINEWKQSIALGAKAIGYRPSNKLIENAEAPAYQSSLNDALSDENTHQKKSLSLRAMLLLGFVAMLLLSISMVIYQYMDAIDTDLHDSKRIAPSFQMEPIDKALNIKKQVEDLLAAAQHEFTNGNVLSSNEENALSYYHQALKLDPGNTVASESIQAIFKQYMTTLTNNIQNQMFANNHQKIQRVKTLLPLFTTVKDAEQQLEAAVIVLSNEEQKLTTINDLLDAAKIDTNAYRLTTPAKRNALEKYKRILHLDPKNELAKRGITTIVEKYIVLAYKAIENGQVKKIRNYIKKIREIDPNHPPLEQLSMRLTEIESITTLKQIKQRNQLRMTQLLAKAKRNIAASQYIMPTEENALKQYREVLMIEPNNIKALNGIDELISIYTQLAFNAVKENEWTNVENHINSLKKINPNHSLITTLQHLLTTKQQVAQQEQASRQKKQKNIQSLLKKAKNFLRNNKHIAPKSNNALANYKAVLELAPNNIEAKKGIDSIGKYFNQLANNAITNHQIEQAEFYLNIAHQHYSNFDELNRTQQRINIAKQSTPTPKPSILFTEDDQFIPPPP